MAAFLPSFRLFHLLGMSLLGGMVLMGDLRLLNLVMKDIPSEVVIENTYKWFNVGLATMIVSGIFMSSAVSLKLYWQRDVLGQDDRVGGGCRLRLFCAVSRCSACLMMP